MTNLELNSFYGLTVAQLLPDKSISFGQVKNTFSGTSLSGNWVLEQNDSDAISSVCRSHILIASKETLGAVEKATSQQIFFGDFNELLISIQAEEQNFKSEWEAYLLANPKKAKTLVPPNWANWSNELSVNEPIESLNRLGRSAHPESTPDDMTALIALARMVRHVIEIWRDLEDSRKSRKFLTSSSEDPRLWPPNWRISERGVK